MHVPIDIRVLDFVSNIPKDVNPYSAAANFLENIIQPPLMPPWAQWLGRCFMFGFVIMFCQAGFLLYLRIKTRRFYLFKSNELGLVRVDCSNMFGLNFFVYSALTITDLACKDFKEVIGRPYLPWQIFLFGSRFIVALDATWSFFWVCVVHCATIKYRSPVSGTLIGRMLIPRSISYAMNTSMILAVVWPIVPIIWTFVRASMEYSQVVDKVSIVTNALEKSASSYSSGHSFVSDLWITLIPASTVLVNMEALSHFVRLGITLYLIVATLLCLAYIPCLIVVIKSMYHRGLTPTRLDNDLTGMPTKGTTDKTIRENTRDVNQRNAVVLLALFAYVSTLVHVPVLIWSMTFTNPYYVSELSWWIGLELGIHGPFSITGNVCLIILNVNAYRILRAKRYEKFLSLQSGQVFTPFQ